MTYWWLTYIDKNCFWKWHQCYFSSNDISLPTGDINVSLCGRKTAIWQLHKGFNQIIQAFLRQWWHPFRLCIFISTPDWDYTTVKWLDTRPTINNSFSDITIRPTINESKSSWWNNWEACHPLICIFLLWYLQSVFPKIHLHNYVNDGCTFKYVPNL